MDGWMDGWASELKRGRPNNAENAERENTRDLQSLHGGASLERSAHHVAGRPAGRPRRHEAGSEAISN